jgi:hypothetical protein
MSESLEPDAIAREAADALEAVARSPERSALFMEALETHLSGDLTSETFDEVDSALTLLVGTSGALALLWASAATTADEFDQMNLGDEAKALVLRSMVLYGPQLNYAHTISGRAGSRAKDWRRFGRQVFINAEGDQVVRTTIKRFDGASIEIEGDAASAVRLTSGMLRTLERVGDLGSIDKEDRDELATLLETVREIAQRAD